MITRYNIMYGKYCAQRYLHSFKQNVHSVEQFCNTLTPMAIMKITK